MNKQWNWKTVLQHVQAIVWTQIVLGFFGYSVARSEVLKRRMDALTK